MTTIALQKELVEMINQIESVSLLQQVRNLIQTSEREVYELSEFQIKKIQISERQLANGACYDQDEMDKMVLEWSKEK
jgi:cell fate (sporulation/competence/biofilm development) regulator YlbF (YheA/YmcA/DUF963 family)